MVENGKWQSPTGLRWRRSHVGIDRRRLTGEKGCGIKNGGGVRKKRGIEME